MASPRTIGVGLLGLGNVGAGVVKLLADGGAALEQRFGARFELRKIAVRDADRPRAVDVPRALITTKIDEVVDHPGCDVVVEVMGGDGAAKDAVLRALERGRHVVTANKFLLAEHGDLVFDTARKAGAGVYFEAAVCGGVPVIRALREGLVADRIAAFQGIVNGTSNYILSTMAQADRPPFERVLADAQAAGYAEADSSFDVDGIDAAHKLAVLLRVVFGARVRAKDLLVEGLRSLQPIDFTYAERFGHVIRPLVIARQHADGLEARVHPTLVPRRWMLASVSGVHNALYVQSEALGNSMYYGRGAGMMPTAVAVLSDLVEVARDVLAGTADRAVRALPESQDLPLRPAGKLRSRYYLRFTVADRPGVLGELARVLGEHDVSISELHQDPGSTPGPVPIVVLTHEALESQVRAALQRIDLLPTCAAPTCLLRLAA